MVHPKLLTREELVARAFSRYWDLARHVPVSLPSDEAQKKARQLLRDVIGEERWAYYQENASFFVTSQYGHKYRIVNGYANNIILYENPDDDEPVGTLCCHPAVDVEGGRMPVEDAMAGQYLAITANERQFLQMANTHGVPSWFEATAYGYAA